MYVPKAYMIPCLLSRDSSQLQDERSRTFPHPPCTVHHTVKHHAPYVIQFLMSHAAIMKHASPSAIHILMLHDYMVARPHVSMTGQPTGLYQGQTRWQWQCTRRADSDGTQSCARGSRGSATEMGLGQAEENPC